jgi:hypothetical protein
MFIGPEPVTNIFSVVFNLEFYGLIFVHNTLRDISLWAQAS